MDRTAEFRAIVQQRRAQSSSAAPLPAVRAPMTRSEFMGEASQIGAAIYATADKLGKLTQLAQSKSLFQDPTAEIDAMTGLIKTEITTLNAKLADLQARMRQTRSRTKQRESHSTSVVESLSSQLRGATSEFQDVLRTRTANMKELQDRRAQFAGGGACGGGACGSGGGAAGGCFGAPPPGGAFGGANGYGGGGGGACGGGGAFGGGGGGGGGRFGSPGPSVPVSIFECPAALASPAGGFGAGGSSSGGGGGGGGGASDEVVIEMPQMQPLEQLQLHDQGNAYLESRANAVDVVQSTIAELGSVFEQLGVLISEQGANLNIIDDNVDDTLINVNAGRDQLMRTMQRYGGNRALIMRVFAVLFFFIVVFGTFFA